MTAAQSQETTVITSKGKKGNKFTKIVLIVVAVLFLIIISEVGYYIFTKNGVPFINLDKSVQEENDGRTISNVPLRPTTPPLQEQESIVINSDKARAFADTLDYLYTNNLLESSDVITFKLYFSGTVTASDFDNKSINNVDYVYSLSIKRQNSNVLTYLLTDEEVDTVQVFRSSNSGKNEVSLTDIKPGDTLVVRENVDLLDASPHSNIILEILE